MKNITTIILCILIPLFISFGLAEGATVLKLRQGGTGIGSVATGDFLIGRSLSGSYGLLNIGTNYQLLQSNSGATYGANWTDSITLTGTIEGGVITQAGIGIFNQIEILELIAGGNFDFFLNDTASGIGTYYEMDISPTSEAESSFSDTITGDDFLIDSFITPTGQPTFTTISAGIYELHFHAIATTGINIKTARIYYEFYKRAAGGAETLISTSEESDVLTDTKTVYNVHCIHSETTIDATDLFLVKVYANIEDGGAPRVNDPVVTFYAEGTNATRFSVNTTIDVFDERYVNIDGDTMTGDLALQDDLNLYFDTAKSYAIYYNSDASGLVYDPDIYGTGRITFASNVGATGDGTYEPELNMRADGSVYLTNTTQGSAGDKYFLVDMTDGFRLKTGGAAPQAIILSDNIAGSAKTFQFPNLSGTFMLATGDQNITTTGTADFGTIDMTGNITTTGIGTFGDLLSEKAGQSWIIADNTTNDYAIAVVGGSAETAIVYDDSNPLRFYEQSTANIRAKTLTAATLQFWFDTNGDANFQGNNLDSVGNIYADAFIASEKDVDIITIDTGGTTWYAGIGSDGNILMHADGYVNLSAGSAQDMLFDTGGDFKFRDFDGGGNGTPPTRVVIKSDTGYVGIGTATPSAELDIIGNIDLDATAATIKFPSATGPHGISFIGGECDFVYRTSPNQLIIENAADDDLFSVDIDDGAVYINNALTVNDTIGVANTGTFGDVSIGDLRLANNDIYSASAGSGIFNLFKDRVGDGSGETSYDNGIGLKLFGNADSGTAGNSENPLLAVYGYGARGGSPAQKYMAFGVDEWHRGVFTGSVTTFLFDGMIEANTDFRLHGTDVFRIHRNTASANAGSGHPVFTSHQSGTDNQPILVFTRVSRRDLDFDVPSSTYPQFWMHDGSANIANVMKLYYDGSDGVISTAAGDLVLSPIGNVGIGTAEPDTLLHVAGAITLDEMTAPGTPDANTATIYLDTADGDLKVRFDDGTVVTIGNKP